MVNASFECENRPLLKTRETAAIQGSQAASASLVAGRACVFKLELDANYAKEG